MTTDEAVTARIDVLGDYIGSELTADESTMPEWNKRAIEELTSYNGTNLLSTDNNKVTAKLKDPKGNDDFYKYGIYTLQVTVKLDIPENATEEQMSALKEQWKQHGHYNETDNIVTETNKAKTNVDGDVTVSYTHLTLPTT